MSQAVVEQVRQLVDGARPTVVVLGDVMLDRYIDGTTYRLSPEAPVPVVQVGRVTASLGGAAMVARVVGALGGRAHLIGVVGNDANGALVQQLVHSECTSSLVIVAGRPTTEKARVRDGTRHLLRIDHEVTTPLAANDEARTLAAVVAALAAADALVLSDYAKGVLSVSLCRSAIAAAQERSLPVIADPKHADLSRYAGATCITPNRLEAQAALALMAGAATDTPFAIHELVHALAPLVAPSTLVVTTGHDGLAYLSGDECRQVPVPVVVVADVTGAGDVVVGTAAVALASKATLHDALHVAALAATASVARAGTHAPDWADVAAV